MQSTGIHWLSTYTCMWNAGFTSQSVGYRYPESLTASSDSLSPTAVIGGDGGIIFIMITIICITQGRTAANALKLVALTVKQKCLSRIQNVSSVTFDNRLSADFRRKPWLAG